MQTQVDSTVQSEKKSEEPKFNQSTVITEVVKEENKSLFNFRRNQLLERGFKMVGTVKEEDVKSFWDFFTGSRAKTYTATFEKREDK